MRVFCSNLQSSVSVEHTKGVDLNIFGNVDGATCWAGEYGAAAYRNALADVYSADVWAKCIRVLDRMPAVLSMQ